MTLQILAYHVVTCAWQRRYVFFYCIISWTCGTCSLMLSEKVIWQASLVGRTSLTWGANYFYLHSIKAWWLNLWRVVSLLASYRYLNAGGRLMLLLVGHSFHLLHPSFHGFSVLAPPPGHYGHAKVRRSLLLIGWASDVIHAGEQLESEARRHLLTSKRTKLHFFFPETDNKVRMGSDWSEFNIGVKRNVLFKIALIT